MVNMTAVMRDFTACAPLCVRLVCGLVLVDALRSGAAVRLLYQEHDSVRPPITVVRLTAQFGVVPQTA